MRVEGKECGGTGRGRGREDVESWDSWDKEYGAWNERWKHEDLNLYGFARGYVLDLNICDEKFICGSIVLQRRIVEIGLVMYIVCGASC